MLRLSTTSKLDGIKSWSLEALSTCPGAHRNGELVPVCRGCYATAGHYRFPIVKNARRANRSDWQTDDWTIRMAAALGTERFLRWFDSGDIYSVDLARKILEVVQRTPWCKHWIPTRSHKIPEIREVLEQIDAEPNAVVRYSADDFDDASHTEGAIVITSPDALPEGATLCRAYETSPAACNGCRACWDKNVPLIAYVAHGQNAKRAIRENSPSIELDKVA